ncbi:hypothetical protein TNCV_2095231 [Trichonephila clavipes]|nr:hypothetical protein TNCV_2095231 [Trichonephila clavipes]
MDVPLKKTSSGKRPKKKRFQGNMYRKKSLSKKSIISFENVSPNKSSSAKNCQVHTRIQKLTKMMFQLSFKPNPVSQKAYDRINAKIADVSEALANASMKKAAAEEKLLIAPKNHSRSAGKMEVCGMQKTFLRSEQKHGLKYQRYIGDGDSKTFLSIAEKEPYGDSVPIVKIECGGHV